MSINEVREELGLEIPAEDLAKAQAERDKAKHEGFRSRFDAWISDYPPESELDLSKDPIPVERAEESGSFDQSPHADWNEPTQMSFGKAAEEDDGDDEDEFPDMPDGLIPVIHHGCGNFYCVLIGDDTGWLYSIDPTYAELNMALDETLDQACQAWADNPSVSP